MMMMMMMMKMMLMMICVCVDIEPCYLPVCFTTQCTERSIPQRGGGKMRMMMMMMMMMVMMMMVMMMMVMMMMVMMCVRVHIACLFNTSSWHVPGVMQGDQPYGGPPPR